jgi:nucleotide-binding universal stress UspA family protein
VGLSIGPPLFSTARVLLDFEVMVSLRQILVPVDFTETSEKALAYAIEFARTMNASLTIMHAYQIPVYGFPDGAYVTTADVAAQISTAAQGRLDALVESLKSSNVPVTAVLRDGVAWEEINAVAAETKADLIIIGTHGRRGLARALLGSVAENVIRTGVVPVLVIHGPRDHESKPPA